MIAGGRFATLLMEKKQIEHVARVTCRLYGSLAYTGKGHGTDRAIILGLSGETPDQIDPDMAPYLYAQVVKQGFLHLARSKEIAFDPSTDIIFDYDTSSFVHPNAMIFEAFFKTGTAIVEQLYYSIGGGFIATESEYVANTTTEGNLYEGDVPYTFSVAEELLALCAGGQMSIAQLVRANEQAMRSRQEVDIKIDELYRAMMGCIERGLSGEGTLPGGLSVRRRAKGLYELATANQGKNLLYPHQYMDRVNAYAIAVNEENAVGGRVVTSPTNGAAGVIPAVLRYYVDQCPGANQEGVRDFLLTATAFGSIIKLNASLSGAEVGCQGEVGSASAMGAAGLCSVLGGTPYQVENAAEIALEHHLGMTCDPVGGLVQVPCIERNAMGAVKAINAASISLSGDGKHIVSFDAVVETMRQTGLDLQTKYKETSEGGLAVTVVEC